MNEEIAMRTLAYLITHYKEHDETIINLEEIQAIEFLQQENARLKDKTDKAINLLEDNQFIWSAMDDEILKILKEN